MERNRLTALVKSTSPYLIGLGALALLVAPTLESLISRWLKFDESYSHGLLMLLVVAIIVARKWKANPPAAGLHAGWLLPFVLALAGYTLGGVLRVEALQELVLIPLILSVLAILIGWDQGKKFILPVGILVFTMPFWDYLSWTLQLVTVAVNEIGLGLLGIDFRIDGVFVFLTGVGAFEVAHGCSGLRYLLVGMSLALLYGELNLKTIRTRVVLFVVAVVLALFANWLRVFIIIYMGYETNMQTSLVEDHDNFGWWVFAATLIPLFLLGRWLERTEVEQNAQDDPVPKGKTGNKRSGPGYLAPLVVLLFCVAALFSLPSDMGVIREIPETYDLSLSGERYAPVFSSGLEGWRPHIRNADRIFQQTLFERPGAVQNAVKMPDVFYASIYSYDFQRQGAEVVQFSNRNYDTTEWRPEDIFTLVAPSGKVLSGVTIQSRITGQQIHFAHGYYVEGVWESDQLRAKLSQLIGFFNTRTDASQITFGVSCGDCNGSERLQQFISQNLSVLLNTIDGSYR